MCTDKLNTKFETQPMSVYKSIYMTFNSVIYNTKTENRVDL